MWDSVWFVCELCMRVWRWCACVGIVCVLVCVIACDLLCVFCDPVVSVLLVLLAFGFRCCVVMCCELF